MILQNAIPYDVNSPRPLPGMAPLEADAWLRVDEVFADQMAERERLISARRAGVIALDESARTAAEELLDMVLAQVLDTALYAREGSAVIRPDGRRVAIDRGDPMASLGRLVQEDFCILDKRGDEHVLLGAVLCFPASWSLDEKFLRPLVGIHVPVESYDDNIAPRVQRLFDGVQPERPLWRFNALWYDDPALHQPRREGERRERVDPARAGFLRSEMQTIRRLPQSRAVVFGIHTYVLARADVPVR